MKIFFRNKHALSLLMQTGLEEVRCQVRVFHAVIFLLFAAPVVNAGIIFQETGSSLSNLTAITVANTSFTYVRSGTGGSIVAVNPGSFEGASIHLGGGSTTSLTGVGWTSGFGNPLVNTVSFQMKSSNLTAGDLFFGIGSGTTFTQNNTFTTAHLSYGFQSDNGVLQRRTSTAWADVGLSLTNNTAYEFRILSNRSGTIQSYTGGLLGNNAIDLYVNDTLIGDELLFTSTSVAADAFRIYQINDGARLELDNISLSNTLDTTAIPEPTHSVLIGLAFCMAIRSTLTARFRGAPKNSAGFTVHHTAEKLGQSEASSSSPRKLVT